MHNTLRNTLPALALVLGAMSTQAENLVVNTTDGHTVTVQPVSPTVVKVTNLAPGQKAHTSRASVLDNAGYNGGKVSVTASESTLKLGTDMTVRANAQGQVTIAGPKGNILLTDNAVRSIAGQNGVELTLAGNGSYYGTGERGHKLNLRGDTLTMYNRQNYGYTGSDARINQMNITMPLFLSTDGYAVVFDDYAAAKLILTDPVQYITEGNEPVSYYFVVSKDGSLASLTESLSELTGRQELPPFWAMGYITSKYGYRTQAETEGAIDTLKTLGYPVDGIVLDLYWYGKEQDMGRLEWEKSQWPDAPDMLAYLKQRGVNLVAISQPYVLRNGKALDNYNYLSSQGMFVADSTGTAPQEVKIWVGEGGMFDVSNPDTRKWLADRYGKLTDMGITGWWGDLGEPEVHPETGLHANGLTARNYHNQYGNDWSEIIFDLFKERYPDTRLMTMMRGGTTGLQRYDVFPWSTDVSRSWGGLEPQITIMTQSGLSGLGYMGHDVGGFAVDPDNAYMPELYLRWLQLGTFSPLLRTHAQQYAEPYHYPQLQDQTLALVRERYRWLPYNYTLAYENAVKGYPMVRPLQFHSTTPDSSTDTIRDQYLWGSEVMVAPVLTEGATSRSVYMPATASLWYDMNNEGTTYTGGSTATVAAPLEVLPMFARAGAFIPTADYAFKNTRDYRTDTYTLNYYMAPEGETTSYTMFEDDRTTPSAKSENKGVLTTFTANSEKGKTLISITSVGSSKGVAPRKTITLKVHGLKSKPNGIKVGEVFAKFDYDKATGVATTTFNYLAGHPLYITISYK